MSVVPAIAGAPVVPHPVLSGMFLPGAEWRRMLAVREGSESDGFWAKNGSWIRDDVARDPHERVPTLLPVSPARTRLRLVDYDREVMALLESRKSDTQPAAATPPPDVLERLKQLGYVQ